jgi:hypothetical protein
VSGDRLHVVGHAERLRSMKPFDPDEQTKHSPQCRGNCAQMDPSRCPRCKQRWEEMLDENALRRFEMTVHDQR